MIFIQQTMQRALNEILNENFSLQALVKLIKNRLSEIVEEIFLKKNIEKKGKMRAVSDYVWALVDKAA